MCDFCKNIKDIREKEQYKGVMTIVELEMPKDSDIRKAHALFYVGKDGHITGSGLKIQYCPSCGRKLADG